MQLQSVLFLDKSFHFRTFKIQWDILFFFNSSSNNSNGFTLDTTKDSIWYVCYFVRKCPPNNNVPYSICKLREGFN